MGVGHGRPTLHGAAAGRETGARSAAPGLAEPLQIAASGKSDRLLAELDEDPGAADAEEIDLLPRRDEQLADHDQV